MPPSVVTRSQRRTEKRQVTWIAILVVAVAVASFALGFVLGQRTGGAGLTKQADKPRLPMATQPVPPPPPETGPAPAEAEKLTFYDNLPKGDQAPLGSGINLPPKPEAASQTASQGRPVSRLETKTRPDVVPEQPVTQPVPSPGGAFVVQVASFRSEGDAHKLVTRLQQLNLSTMIERADLADKGVWHRVLAGPYANRADADRVAEKLQQEERLSALVKRR